MLAVTPADMPFCSQQLEDLVFVMVFEDYCV